MPNGWQPGRGGELATLPKTHEVCQTSFKVAKSALSLPKPKLGKVANPPPGLVGIDLAALISESELEFEGAPILGRLTATVWGGRGCATVVLLRHPRVR